MVRGVSFYKRCCYLWLFLAFVLMFVACQTEKQVAITVDRFDVELYHLLTHPQDTVAENHFLVKYADFLPMYISGVLKCKSDDDLLPIEQLRRFFAEKTLMRLYSDEIAKFKDVKSFESLLCQSMAKYKDWFPKDSLPRFALHVSGLSQSVITTDSLVSVSGDKYLGADYPLYKSFFYSYQLPAMQTKNLVRDALRAFLQSRFPENGEHDLLALMVYEGAILVATEELMGNVSQEDLLEYSTEQLKWLKVNEKGIWLYMVENDHLYSTDQMVLLKYIGESPFTSYFGQESPSKIGVYIGYQVVRSYMKKQHIPIQEVLKHIDSKLILSESGYR